MLCSKYMVYYTNELDHVHGVDVNARREMRKVSSGGNSEKESKGEGILSLQTKKTIYSNRGAPAQCPPQSQQSARCRSRLPSAIESLALALLRAVSSITVKACGADRQ